MSIECPLCSGRSCDKCEEGFIEIKGCPNAYCSSIVPAIDLIDLFDKGLPPITGGVLDQAYSFIQAARYFESEERRVKHGD